ncbi:UNVERIFIED_CONTAM: hypothetical protein Sradi_6891500 [Sesamum radiatum]|uniref:DUF4283 domain-containing protein n=1 Tax=Sesamum radiatum TaxID=300843 RepID=A0AAW2JIR7_SESRA
MLSSLTPSSHSDSQESSLPPEDGDPDGGGGTGDPLGPSQPASMEERVRQEFNFAEFYSLASRVMDGDDESLGKLVDLKIRWERRFPDPARVRRVIPRFPTKLTFLPRRTIVPSMADSGDEGSGSLLNRGSQAEPTLENSAQDVQDSQDSQDVPRASPSIRASPPTPVSAPEVFVGNVKLAMGGCDTIADAFLNSSRKTLRFIPPISQKDEILIKPTAEMVAQGSRRWQSTAVGYFLGRRPYFPNWRRLPGPIGRGCSRCPPPRMGFFFRFKTTAFMEEVIEEGPWLFQGQPVVLQPWEQGMSLRRQKHLQVPVWIRIRHLPMEYWTEDGLSAVASGIGTPLYSDKITKNCLRLDFARVCVMLHYHSKLPKHLIVLSPILAEGKEVPIKVDIEYEWLPLRCSHCCSLGHMVNACPEKRVAKQRPPVAVYVQKSQSTGEENRGNKRMRWSRVGARWRRIGLHVLITKMTSLGKTWPISQPHTDKISCLILRLLRQMMQLLLLKVKKS